MSKQKLFVHIPKNGGMSIRRNIHPNKNNVGSTKLRGKVVWDEAQRLPSQYRAAVKKHMDANGEHHGFGHARWRDIDKSYTNKYQAFAIVRNPWSKVVSRYTFLMNAFEQKKPRVLQYYDKVTFEEFIEERHRWGEEPYFWHRAIRGWYPQYDHVMDENDELKCDLIRLEHFDNDIQKYLNLSQPLSTHNVSSRHGDHKPYKEYYTDKTIQIIADWYQKDIDYFGFDFDTPATKHTMYGDNK